MQQRQGKRFPILRAAAAADEVKNAADYAGTLLRSMARNSSFAAEGNKLVLVHANRRVVLERVGGDRFLVKHPDFDTYLLGFVRENQQVTQAFTVLTGI
jgi:hypothetical protein